MLTVAHKVKHEDKIKHWNKREKLRSVLKMLLRRRKGSKKGLRLNAGHDEKDVNFPTVNPETTLVRQICTLKQVR